MSLRHARQGDVFAEDDAPGIVLVDAYPGLSVSFGFRHYYAAGVGARLHFAWKTKAGRTMGVTGVGVSTPRVKIRAVDIFGGQTSAGVEM